MVGALSLLAGRHLLPTPEQVRADVNAIVALGGVDGVTLKSEPTVDGQPLAAGDALLQQIEALL